MSPVWRHRLKIKSIWDSHVGGSALSARRIAGEIAASVEKLAVPGSALWAQRLYDFSLGKQGEAAFNRLWDKFYNWADENRVWVET